MLSVHIDNINDLAVVECEGRMVGSEAAFRLREAVTKGLSTFRYAVRSKLNKILHLHT
jgi:hypothetical protein